MGLFDFFKKSNANGQNIDHEDPIPTKEIFIEEREPGELVKKIEIGLDEIYNYANTDFEEKGFNDALTNPDYSYSEDNLKLLKYDLQIIVQRALNNYEQKIMDVNFHIESRKRAGLIDTVQQLETFKNKIDLIVKKVSQIDEDYKNNTGLVERIELSYKRGFMRGLAALSDKILTNN